MLDPKEEDLEKLAETCLSTARQIKEYLAANNQPPLTFDADGPAFFPSATPEVQHARLDLRAAAMRLYHLASGPDEVVSWHVYHCAHDLNAFRYVQHYNIASAVPTTSGASISYGDLARQLSLDASQLRQMLRQLMTIHVFQEPSPGQVSHTASSRLLTHWGVGAFNSFVAEDTFPAVARQIEALERWGHGRPEPNRAALNLFYDTDLPMYEYYECDGQVETEPNKEIDSTNKSNNNSTSTSTSMNKPDNDDTTTTNKPTPSDTITPSTTTTSSSSTTTSRRERFSRLMTYMASTPIMSNAHIAHGFDWSSLPPGSTVVDIAGNVGHSAIPIAQANATAKIVVQDLPKIVARAVDPSTSVIPPELRPRFTFMPHDFYSLQPVRGAAVYFLRMILHDYSDPYAMKILRAVVPSMAPESRIVIMDQVMPPAVGLVPDPVERMMRTQDLQMMMLTNAKERDAGEWDDLLRKAGDGLVEGVFGHSGLQGKRKRLGIMNIQTPPGSTMSLIEVGFVDEGDEE
ncbi:hypothetical protein A1O1_05553 [Capronia coronata CBS 617.96]|uniref:O-methyltransferase C-terminal domain-containing protein n=1 Tax=Capronia coronata CBS 617.96 TaxID=1182541 RepID=W9Y7W4_9EURO|nr:uncharacterized protein A1O1_05553 [Capronia coronata CBS 617.96]EXJ88623.1 hypothetical protein A1O1_05553 [Capronia coronata CBS 617.96]